MPDSQESAPIRRGRGLRLSTEAAQPEASAEAPVEAPAEVAPIARGRGLRLTTTEEAAPVAGEATPVTPPPGPPPPPTATATIERLQAQLPGGRVSYLRAGEGPPLLLLHGFGASGEIWRGVIGALVDAYTCYALDLPGFGASPARPATPTLASLADDVLALADALGLERFALVGHALGAAVAATVAGRQSGRAARLVLSGFGVRPFAPELMALGMARTPLDLSVSFARPLTDFWRPFNRRAMASPPVALLLGAQLLQGPPADQELWQAFLADHAAADGRAYITAVTASGDPRLHAALRAIVVPTLLVNGREDRVAPIVEAAAAQRLVQGSAIAVIESCGHLPQIERPAEYHAALRAFLG